MSKAAILEARVKLARTIDRLKAVWSTAYVNALPDSAFLFIQPGGKKDATGRTTPRSLRHFPVRDHNGKPDPPHLRNALSRIPQAGAWLDADTRAKLIAEAQRLLAEANKAPTKKRAEVQAVARVRLIKNADPADERFVLGVVLEPETVDAQKDIYSAAEIRKAAHRFMEEYGSMGLMHEWIVNAKIVILETFIAPVDFEIAGEKVKAGTWLLGARIVDDELWAETKSGDFTGWSIGGDAIRTPDAEADAAFQQAQTAAEPPAVAEAA